MTAVVVGDTERPPTADEVMRLVTSPGQQVIVNTMGVSIDERPAFFASLYTRLQDLRAHLGRPHWIALDEAHHLLPSDWNPTALLLPEDLSGVLLLTVRTEHIAPAMLRHMDLVIVVGSDPQEVINAFCREVGERPPRVPCEPLDSDQALIWDRQDDAVMVVHPVRSRSERRRHIRKYASGELAPEKSFYFRRPTGKLNLRATNLTDFARLAAHTDPA